ncbi:DeoR/GlpR family DNA-binding transcription regulator [Solitalea sp. MAHUQ-68]|uniref:DeoR/GlpR family DNA-binding transcription regulator n=1 Tax=Solitalea agri TaxID=2953739 RepID=A0A9X2JD89_9SPHI|nr:DeoR/GlpR family DNA-binding transcription regulator [Solitalea agri]MCO4294277.1 DeoR/GlpR family DNA-binding transcription regulator [Solitalea agri]
MLKEERQNFIIKQINLHNKVLSADLSRLLNVSEDTIRRDLNELSELGQIIKVHGGALSKSFHFPFADGETYAKDAKKIIAKKAVGLIEDGMVVLAGGGTTMIEIARAIPKHLKCTFFTISPLVALELVENTNSDVILIGGQLSPSAHISIGSQVINQLSEINVDLCFLGTNGLSVENGITDSDWEAVQVKKAMLKASRKTAIVTIGEKLETTQNLKVCGLNAIHYLITDLVTNSQSLLGYHKYIEVI